MANWERGVHTWDETEDFLVSEASADLEGGEDVRPCLVAFRDEEPLFVAFLRSFVKGEYADPVIELVALAAPLFANRLAMSVGARAWSLDDPLPPVVPGVGDLRQRVLSITFAEEDGGGVSVRSVVVPFDHDGHSATWLPALRHPGGEGWIPSALALAIEHRADLATSVKEMRRQARRCVALGHLLALSPAVAEELDVGGVRPG